MDSSQGLCENFKSVGFFLENLYSFENIFRNVWSKNCGMFHCCHWLPLVGTAGVHPWGEVRLVLNILQYSGTLQLLSVPQQQRILCSKVSLMLSLRSLAAELSFYVLSDGDLILKTTLLLYLLGQKILSLAKV